MKGGGLGIWLINLDRSVGRLATMTARLAALGVPYSRFPAIDGRQEWDKLVADVDQPAFRRNTGREVLPGEIGCYASHLAVWREFLGSAYEVALILEDDVVFHDDFPAAVDALMSVTAQWDMVKLNCIRAKQPVLRRRVGSYRLNAYLGAFTGMGAYMVSREFAAAEMASMLPMARPIDHRLDRFSTRGFRHYGLEPFPSHVDDGNQSTITGKGFAEVKKFPRYARLPAYGLRIANFGRKTAAILLSREA